MASAAMALSVAHTAQMVDRLHIRNFILRTAPGIWMIFSQCSEMFSADMEVEASEALEALVEVDNAKNHNIVEPT